MSDARDIIIRPIISEKSIELSQMRRYTFEVARGVTKPHIAQAIQEIFGVTVTSVNTMTVPSKPRRVRQVKGKTRSWKKAVVTLKEGDSIEFYSA